MSKPIVTLFVVVVLVAFTKTLVIRTDDEIKQYENYLRSTVIGEPTVSDDPELAELQQLWENSGKFEGDIILTEEQINRMVDEFSGKKNAILDTSRLWPSKKIYYFINVTTFTTTEITNIQKAIDVMNNSSCVQFEPWTNQTGHIRIQKGGGGCSATLGYTGTRQFVNLGTGCVTSGTIIHELLHSLGFYHQQSTHDRDNWVTIVWSKIQPGKEANFNKLNSSQVTNLGQTYDYGSVMHYSQYAFSVDGNRTIIPTQPTNISLGFKPGMSSIDLIKLNLLYSCPGF